MDKKMSFSLHIRIHKHPNYEVKIDRVTDLNFKHIAIIFGYWTVQWFVFQTAFHTDSGFRKLNEYGSFYFGKCHIYAWSNYIQNRKNTETGHRVFQVNLYHFSKRFLEWKVRKFLATADPKHRHRNLAGHSSRVQIYETRTSCSIEHTDNRWQKISTKRTQPRGWFRGRRFL